MSPRPLVLIVDDSTSDDAAQMRADKLSQRGKVDAVTLHPRALTSEIIEQSTLVLVDYVLDHWPTRDILTEIALQPKNGLALAAVIREHCAQGLITAVALLSGDLEKVFGSVPPQNRRHLLARVASLEWTFSKADEYLYDQIESLANAVERIRRARSPADSFVWDVLSLGRQVEFFTSARDDVLNCIPPIHELERLTQGHAFIRWLSQRVLPYPTFLIDDFYLSARLNTTVETLRTALQPGRSLYESLKVAEYKGALESFLGRRWWRAGIDHWLWVRTNGRAFSADAVFKAVLEASNHEVTKSDAFPESAVVVDSDFMPKTELAKREACVRVMPDDWPHYASPALVELSEAGIDDELKQIVHVDDEWKLDESGSK